jgi:hypothetical protein
MQKPQLMQAGLLLSGLDKIASGAGCAFQPIFLAPRSSNTPDDLTGMGGIGNGFDLNESFGPGAPDTPISQSTLV